MREWISSVELADLAGIKRQSSHEVLNSARSRSCYTWRGTAPLVRTVRGRGGRSGLRYEVRVDSLPAELQRRFNELYGDAPPQLSHGPKAQEEQDFRNHVIAGARSYPKGSRERRDAIREAAAQQRWRPGRKPFHVSERTVERWLAIAEECGNPGRRKRSDAGQAAVIIGRIWDKAVPFDDETRASIAHDLRQYIRGLIKDGDAGEGLRRLANARLVLLTRRAGFDPGAAELEAACVVPLHRRT